MLLLQKRKINDFSNENIKTLQNSEIYFFVVIEIEQLESENRKLEHRLETLKRAIEQEAKNTISTSGVEKTKK